MLKIENISKQYDRPVLKKVSIDFPETGFFFIVGENGSGKSTLINIILGLETFDEGKIYYQDKIIDDFVEFRKNETAVLFQNYALIDHFTIEQNLMFPLYGIKNNFNKNDLVNILKKVNLNKDLNTLCKNLSGGEKQRVGLARAILLNKNIYICDEPTGALDKDNAENIFSILKEISKTKLVICVCHDKYFIDKYADFIFSLNDYTYKKTIKQKNIRINNNSFENKNISFFDKLKISVVSLKKRKVRSVICFLSCFIVSLTLLILLSLSYSLNNSFNNIFTQYIDYNHLEVSLNKKTSSNNGFSFVKASRPNKDNLEEIINDRYEITYNFDYIFNQIKTENNVIFRPIYNLDQTKYSSLSKVLNNLEYYQVFANNSAIDLLKDKFEIFFEMEIITYNQNFSKAKDYLKLEKEIEIVKVIDEFEYIKEPVIYYSYSAICTYFSKIPLANASKLLNRVFSLYDRLTIYSSDEEELSSYKYSFWVNKNEVEYIYNLLKENGYDVYSNALDSKNSLYNIVEIIQKIIILFLVVSFIVFLILSSIVLYSFLLERKQEIALYRLFCLNDSSIEAICRFDYYLINLSSLMLSSVLLKPFLNIINNIISKYIDFSLLFPKKIYFFNYDIFLLFIFFYLICFVISNIPLKIFFKQKIVNLIRED